MYIHLGCNQVNSSKLFNRAKRLLCNTSFLQGLTKVPSQLMQVPACITLKRKSQKDSYVNQRYYFECFDHLYSTHSCLVVHNIVQPEERTVGPEFT